MTTVTLTGRLTQRSSKCGIQFLTLEVSQPFNFEVMITVTGDPEHDTDDQLIEALMPYLDQSTTVVCDVDEDGDLSATPSRMSTPTSGQSDPWSENVRLAGALDIIASYAHGGVCDTPVALDRSEMILIARGAKRGLPVEKLREIRR